MQAVLGAELLIRVEVIPASLVDIPDDIEQFNIMPPELDELSRWIQETSRAQDAEMKAAQEQAASGEGPPPGAGVPPGGPADDDDGPVLWTPGAP